MNTPTRGTRTIITIMPITMNNIVPFPKLRGSARLASRAFLSLVFLLGCSRSEPIAFPTPIPTPTVGEIIKETDPITSFGRLAPPDLGSKLPQIGKTELALEPQLLSSSYPSGRYFNCIVQDSKLAVACVRGVDVFNPVTKGSLSRIHHFDTPGHAWNVKYLDEMFWVADDYAGITVMNPETGAIVARWNQLDNARAVYAFGDDAALICRHSHGATLVSRKLTSQPEIISELPVQGRIFSAWIDLPSAYLGSLDGGYQAFDMTDPAHPSIAWTFEGPERILWCQKKDGYHYLADQDFGLWVLKDNGNARPDLISRFELSGQVRDGIFWNDSTLLLARREGLSVIDVSQPTSPRLIDHFKAGNEGRGLTGWNYRIFFSDGDLGIKEFELTDQRKLRLVADFSNDRLTTDVGRKDDYVFTTETHKGIGVARINRDHHLEQVTDLQGFDYAVNLDIRDNLLAVTDYTGLKLVDITDPANPSLISSLQTPGRATGVFLSGSTALVADWFEGVHFVDIGSPESPVIVSSVKTDGWVIDVTAKDHYAYVCAMNNGLMTVDFKNLKKPILTTVDTNIGAPEGAWVAGKALYVADFNAGLIVYDVGNPAKPEPSGYFSMKLCKGISVRDRTMVVSDYFYGIKIFDISDPFNPILTGEFDTPGKSYESVFSETGDEILTADWHNLLFIKL